MNLPYIGNLKGKKVWREDDNPRERHGTWMQTLDRKRKARHKYRSWQLVCYAIACGILLDKASNDESTAVARCRKENDRH
jgi:hypothetical protein